MKNQSGTIKTNLELYRVVMGGSVGYRRFPGESDHFSWHTDRHSIIIYISSSQSSAAPWPLIIAANWCFPFDQELFYRLLAPFPKVLAGAKPRLAPAPTCPFFIIIIILFTIIIINIIILFVIIIIIIIVVIFILTIKISIVSSLSFSHNINWPGFPYTIEINTNINMS